MSSFNTDPWQLFNAKLLEFMQDLIDTYKHDGDFVVCKNLTEISISYDYTMPQQIFHMYVVDKYEEQIVTGNEDFFLQETYDPSVTDIQVVNKLKQMWQTLDPNNKKIVWQYMQVLVVLDRKCTALAKST